MILLDSKYRTCELPFRADYFIARWHSADDSLRRDMERSLGDFPAVLESEVDKIIEFLNSMHRDIAARSRDAMAKQRDEHGPERIRLYVEIYRTVLERGPEAWRIVGENRWFRVLQSITELYIEPKPAFDQEPPSEAELRTLASPLPEGLYKWAIERACLSSKLNANRRDGRSFCR